MVDFEWTWPSVGCNVSHVWGASCGMLIMLIAFKENNMSLFGITHPNHPKFDVWYDTSGMLDLNLPPDRE